MGRELEIVGDTVVGFKVVGLEVDGAIVGLFVEG